MNAEQKRYAMKRIDSILARYLAQANEDWKPTSLSDNDKVKLIARDKVVVRPNWKKGLTAYTDVVDIFDFSKWEKAQEKVEVSRQRVHGQLRQKAAAICDQIMLGDEAEAIKMIAQFEKEVG